MAFARPDFLRARWRTALAAGVACILIGLPEWRRPEIQMGVGIDPLSSPAGAADFLERHDIHGRFFNHFELGGYLAWRFWPDRSRLPFMDIHQSGTQTDRLIYEAVMSSRPTWTAAAARYDFDAAILRRIHARGDSLLDFLDADSSFALVFVDDVAAVYVRRSPRFAAVVDSLQYRVLPGGMRGLGDVGRDIDRVPGMRSGFREELERAAASSAANSSIRSLLATLNIQEDSLEAARADLEHAHSVDPLLPLYYLRLAEIDRKQQHWAACLRNLREARRHGEVKAIESVSAAVLEQMGKPAEAHRDYAKALRADPGNATLQEGFARTAGH
jgi:tetratricopeptide (TPR) repeat protein